MYGIFLDFLNNQGQSLGHRLVSPWFRGFPHRRRTESSRPVVSVGRGHGAGVRAVDEPSRMVGL